MDANKNIPLKKKKNIFNILFVSGMKPFTWNEVKIVHGWWSKLKGVDIVFL